MNFKEISREEMTTLRDFQLALQKNMEELDKRDVFISELVDELADKNYQV